MHTGAFKSVRSAMRLGQFSLVLAGAFVLGTGLARAQQQVVVTDVTYTATADNTMDSHYRVSPGAGTPANWRSPVDYASGTAYVRLEVLTKPSTQKTIYNICFEGNQAACMGYPPAYTAPGTYDFSFAFSTFWQYSAVDWTKGVQKVALILKNENGDKVQGDANFYPTMIHVVITLVAPGGTYVPPSMVKDAGAPVDAGMPIDAGSAPDAMALDSATKPASDAKVDPEDAGTVKAPDAALTTPAPQAGAAPSAGSSGAERVPSGGAGSTGSRDAAVIPLYGADAAPDAEPHAGSSSSGGCSVGARSDTPGAGWWLAICLSLVWCGRRRRVRTAVRTAQ
jgi:hypothetical protein